jgi:hypothetical protein
MDALETRSAAVIEAITRTITACSEDTSCFTGPIASQRRDSVTFLILRWLPLAYLNRQSRIEPAFQAENTLRSRGKLNAQVANSKHILEGLFVTVLKIIRLCHSFARNWADAEGLRKLELKRLSHRPLCLIESPRGRSWQCVLYCVHHWLHQRRGPNTLTGRDTIEILRRFS